MRSVEHDERLPELAASSAHARRALDGLDGRPTPEALADAKLLASEPVADVVDHVREDGDIGLVIALGDGLLRVEIHDPGPGLVPRPRRPGQPEDSGCAPALRQPSRLALGRRARGRRARVVRDRRRTGLTAPAAR